VAAQNDVNRIYPPLVFAALGFTSALITLCLPETMHTGLPEDMADVRPGPFQSACQRYWHKLNKTSVSMKATECHVRHTVSESL
jgi:hypothetical protein